MKDGRGGQSVPNEFSTAQSHVRHHDSPAPPLPRYMHMHICGANTYNAARVTCSRLSASCFHLDWPSDSLRRRCALCQLGRARSNVRRPAAVRLKCHCRRSRPLIPRMAPRLTRGLSVRVNVVESSARISPNFPWVVSPASSNAISKVNWVGLSPEPRSSSSYRRVTALAARRRVAQAQDSVGSASSNVVGAICGFTKICIYILLVSVKRLNVVGRFRVGRWESRSRELLVTLWLRPAQFAPSRVSSSATSRLAESAPWNRTYLGPWRNPDFAPFCWHRSRVRRGAAAWKDLPMICLCIPKS